MNKLTSVLHDATHRVPGVPAHRENQLLHQPSPRLRDEHSRPRKPERDHRTPPHHQAPPRVLIAWQNWIGQHIGTDSHQR